MSWYKKAQLAEALPYFEEFKDYGEYVPNEEKLTNKLSQMGLSLGEEIGRGDSGVAFLLSNGDILKITTNNQEGEVAASLVGKNIPSIIDIRDVWKEGDLYYIIEEKLEKSTLLLDDIVTKLSKILDISKCYSPQCALDILPKNSFFNSLSEGIKNSLTSYISHLSSLPIKIYDFLNPANIGIKDGNIKFFDIT